MKRVSNESVLKMVRMTRSLMVTIGRRQLRFVGHAVRKEGLEKLVLAGKKHMSLWCLSLIKNASSGGSRSTCKRKAEFSM